jgi:hypothetical protein
MFITIQINMDRKGGLQKKYILGGSTALVTFCSKHGFLDQALLNRQ